MPTSRVATTGPTFLQEAELRDVLDLVSTALSTVRSRNAWIDGVRRIFAEEHVRYRVNDAGGVRYAIDESFEQGNAATIAALGGDRYATTLATFENALTAFVAIPPRGKDAIRGVFSAVEGLFKLMFGTGQLGDTEVENTFRPVVEKRFADSAARGAAMAAVRGFRAWVASAHSYRS